jgi:hypothetical protein
VALDTQERERVRYHMGYLSVQPAASITFGLPAPIQTLFLLELAMDKILPEAEDRVRRLLTVLDGIECRMIDGQNYLVATQLDQMYIRTDHIEALEWEYSRWASRLSDELGAPLYPGSHKFTKLFRNYGSGGNIPVRNT